MKETHECTIHYCEGGLKNEDMLDVMILSYGRNATQWVTYLTSCFQQISREQNRPPFKLVCVQLEDVFLGVTSLTQLDRLAKARLQIVILCPGFLEQISANPGPASALTTLLQPGRAIVMLLGVSDESVNIQHRAALLSFDEWRKVEVKDQDPSFVSDFLSVAMDILSRSWQIQQAINQIRNEENKAYFSVIPKKIKVGQNKLIVLLNDPLKPDDKIHITIDKNGQKLEAVSVKRRNPYTLQFAMPATCLQVSMLASIFIEKNGKSLGHRLVKCESQMRELEQLLRSTDNPLQFMSQTLGLNPGDREQLDVCLAAAIQRNIPPHFNILQPAVGHRFLTCNEEYPTLLHFAARFGLEKLSWILLECPGGEQACQLRNTCQLTPAEMAERAGHVALANALKGYLQMTELSSMYSYLKRFSGKETDEFNDSNYLLPRPLNDTYLIPPAARPISTSSLATSSSVVTTSTSCPTTPLIDNFTHFYTNVEAPHSPNNLLSSAEYNVPPMPLPIQLNSIFSHQLKSSSPNVSPSSSIPTTPNDNAPPGVYLDMHPSDKSSLTKMTCSQLCCDQQNLKDQLSNRLGHTTSFDSIPGNRASDSSSRSGTYRKGSTSSTSTKHSQHGVQDELVEIINDFKNNVFTIGEVEKLVASWQNRHDVQQSFKEKQEQLNAMREEYERIQQAMKQQLKRPTPFERIRKFFTRGKSKHALCSDECRRNPKEASRNGPTGSICHRPASSLSLRSSCSSGSSGQMSTESGTSLGDSGTHSDPDDKKNSPSNTQLHMLQQDIRCKLSSSSLHYDVPPSSTDLRLARPPPLTDLTEYVVPDNPKPNMNLGFFARSTSLTEDDTIHEDHEHPTNCNSETSDENKAEECKGNNEKEIPKNFEEADREIAVVEVHPPPPKVIALPSPSDEGDDNNTTEPDESNIAKKEDNKTDDIGVNQNDNATLEIVQNKNAKEEQSDESVQTTSNDSCDSVYNNEDDTNVLAELNDVVNEMINDLNACNKNERLLPISEQSDVNCSLTEKHNCELVAVDYNSDEESAKETDRLLENLQIHDYINVSGQYPPPPVPPRGKYSHLTL